ncbi:MAG: Ditrans,polycis-undecaprenyl-diphosphate synthase ((2E,6E)-farnesyl-diphosphate specific) [Firmicutes bacterium ADurb.Bin248]|nr:MAG: Ditrans,polycis-undecaprenyl-diphosphate synthase ((2E,6E)-farnesyl-diphosphate specific) [Firmicutes bacterium ADurb.Bin248]HOG01499.1 polyprenyl diphosphate synthase [Clostridia bacterium]HPK15260.1 polyprenyl diphosphate synthase [Clostridia bacterium]
MKAKELAELKKRLAPLPRHVGIIMDGNGRWASARGLPRPMGHRAGTERLRSLIRLSSDLGIEALSLYAFSTENWKRPRVEVETLFAIFMDYFNAEVEALHQNGVRITAMGDLEGLPESVRLSCLRAMEKTRANAGLRLNIALNYGSRAELGRAARLLAKDAASGRLDPASVDEASLQGRLWVADLPDVDLLIRTGGEKRLSNFMLLQLAYAELAFVEDYWPDFSDERYIEALADFAGRSRRFGGLDGE